MSRIVNRAENWERAYEAFQQVNFAAWDFNSVKESLVDYLKLYYPEDFNDFIESSELIALLELFAYIATQVAYRLDLNANENFLSTAQRKESVLRIAKMLSYKASRNIPHRGLVKVTSISTTETVFDSLGNNLANVTIKWNDPLNPQWKEQFILVMNRVLDQDFGTVLPSDRVQVQDVLFERYLLNNNPLVNNVIPYNVNVSNEQFPMELVSSSIDEFGPFETRPEKNLKLGILYLSDGLGDSSDNTGFFLLTKQGTMNRTTATFDGITPNQTFDVNLENTNDIDIWVNNIDPDTGEIIDTTGEDEREGKWEEVDLAGGQNVVFNLSPNRNKYEVETLDNDEFRLIFGDGNFAAIPSGNFEIWSRSSANTDSIIPTTSIQNIVNSITYQDITNREQTFAFSVSLKSPMQNAAPSEDLERLKRVVPSIYYTQDRMVNAIDYNEFPLQDNSILKLRSINRTFAGDSKYIPWHDPRESYENVKIFADDGVVFFDTREICEIVSSSVLPAENPPNHELLVNALILNHLQPVLSTPDIFTMQVLAGIAPASVRTTFTQDEIDELTTALIEAIDNKPTTVYLTFDDSQNEWIVNTTEPTDFWITFESRADDDWELCYESKRLVILSKETKFWNVNDPQEVITTDTFRRNLDNIVILKANTNFEDDVLTQNYNFDVISQTIIEQGEDKGLKDKNSLYIIPTDENGDGFPDNIDLSYLFDDTEFVYFNRQTTNDPWVFQPFTPEVFQQWDDDTQGLWKRENGIEGINFAWFHRTPRYHLIDPAPSNIIDMYIITRGFNNAMQQWLRNQTTINPQRPTPFTLRTDYRELLENKMISDTVILHPGNIKIIFGSKASPELRGVIKVVRSQNRTMTSNQIKSAIVDITFEFFDINQWEFGETFYFTELATLIQTRLARAIDSVVLVPTLNTHTFGDLFQVFAREDEIIQPNLSVDDIEIVESLDPRTLQQRL